MSIEELKKKLKGKESFKKEHKEKQENIVLMTQDNAEYILEKGEKAEDYEEMVKAVREANLMILDEKKANAEVFERFSKIGLAGITTAAGIAFMYLNYKFNKDYMMLVFNQKDSLEVLDNRSFMALTRNKDNLGRTIETSMKGVIR